MTNKNSAKNLAVDTASRLQKEDADNLPLGKANFILMAIAGALIVLGFCLMLGGATEFDSFNPDIFSTRRIVVGPTIAFIGFIFMGFAIMYNPKK